MRSTVKPPIVVRHDNSAASAVRLPELSRRLRAAIDATYSKHMAVTDYARNGMPVLRRGGAGKEGQYDAVDCFDWWREQQGRNAKEAAQTRLYLANAGKAEADLERKRGDLVPRDEVILAGQSFVKGWTAKIRTMPPRLRHSGIINRDQEGGVAAFCREILSDISSWKSVADAMASAPDEGPQ